MVLNHIVVVSASEDDQRDRECLARRWHVRPRNFEKMKSLQMPDAEKRKACRYDRRYLRFKFG